MSEVVLVLLVVGGGALAVSLALAPLESLRWWAGWLGPDDGLPGLPAGGTGRSSGGEAGGETGPASGPTDRAGGAGEGAGAQDAATPAAAGTAGRVRDRAADAGAGSALSPEDGLRFRRPGGEVGDGGDSARDEGHRHAVPRGGEAAGDPAPGAREGRPSPPGADPPAVFVVFLSGIGSISGDALLPQERSFLERLSRALPEARIVADVFPYAPSGRSLLTGQRFFSGLWRLVDRLRVRRVAVLPAILNLRNMFQVLVSADGRYGPIYSFALARMIRDGLARQDYARAGAAPVVLLGFSGGGQISVGAATYLAAALSAPILVVTIGGVMASDRGLEAVERLTCLYGARDGVQRLGWVVFPGRWPAMRGSFWNRADAAGRIALRRIGDMRHAGRGGYMDGRRDDPGEPAPAETTAAEVVRAIREDLARLGRTAHPDPAPAPAEGRASPRGTARER